MNVAVNIDLSKKLDRAVLDTALAAAIFATNDWLSNSLRRRGMRVQLLRSANAKRVARKFVKSGARPRTVPWDWEHIYFRKVHNQSDAWLFALEHAGRPGALCYGRVAFHEGYVSVEYLERKTTFRSMKGLATIVSFKFAQAVAQGLDLPEVRLNDPDPALVAHFMATLGLNRHPIAGAVKYLFHRHQP